MGVDGPGDPLKDPERCSINHGRWLAATTEGSTDEFLRERPPVGPAAQAHEVAGSAEALGGAGSRGRLVVEGQVGHASNQVYRVGRVPCGIGHGVDECTANEPQAHIRPDRAENELPDGIQVHVAHIGPTNLEQHVARRDGTVESGRAP